MARRKLYLIVLAFSLLGYAWLVFNYMGLWHGIISVCPFRFVTDIPCPSCGITSALLKAANGEFYAALVHNPLVTIAFVMLIALPVWVTADMFRGSSSFLAFYLRTEKLLRIRSIALVAALLVITIWARNIYLHFTP